MNTRTPPTPHWIHQPAKLSAQSTRYKHVVRWSVNTRQSRWWARTNITCIVLVVIVLASLSTMLFVWIVARHLKAATAAIHTQHTLASVRCLHLPIGMQLRSVALRRKRRTCLTANSKNNICRHSSQSCNTCTNRTPAIEAEATVKGTWAYADFLCIIYQIR